MLFKTLTDLYFDNRVRVIPPGAISFFGYLDELECLLKTPNLIDLNEANILEAINGAGKVTIINVEGEGKDKISRVNQKMRELISLEKAGNVFGTVFHVIGDEDLMLYDVSDIAENIYGFLKEDTEIVFSAMIDEGMENKVKIRLVLAEA